MYRPHPRPTESEFLGVRPCHQYFYEGLQGLFVCLHATSVENCWF